MGEPFRRLEAAASPGALGSPRGVRSPAVPRQDSTGTLRTTIQLGKTGASIVHTGPFYLMKELAGEILLWYTVLSVTCVTLQ